MGWFDSDYEATGSVSFSQIAQQRRTDDSYIGELIVQNTKTGENIAANIRSEIFDLSTAKLRRYHKWGTLKGFTGSISFPESIDIASILPIMRETDDVDSIVQTKIGIASLHTKAIASMSHNGGLRLESGNTPNNNIPYIYFLEDSPSAPYVKSEYTVDDGAGGYILYFNVTDDGTPASDVNVSTNINVECIEGTGICSAVDSPTARGMTIEYLYNGYTYLYYSEDTRLLYDGTEDSGNSFAIDIMPVVSLKDASNHDAYNDGSGNTNPWFSTTRLLEQPYYLNDPDTSDMYKDRELVLDKFDVDFYEMSESIFDPVPLPDVGTPEWDGDYGKTYDTAIKNCALDRASDYEVDICAFADEQAWHDDMATSAEEQKDSIKNLTDVHFGIYASAKTLDMSNVVALFYTLQPLMGNIAVTEQYEGWSTGGDSTVKKFAFQVTAGSLKITHKFANYTYVRRSGIVAYEWEIVPTLKLKKGAHRIIEGPESKLLVTDGDPLLEVIFPGLDEADSGETDYEGNYTSTGTFSSFDGIDTCLQLRVQSEPDINGDPTYLEMRFFNMTASHTIDVLYDGTENTAQTVTVEGSLAGMDEIDYSDVVIFPITKDAVDLVPIFKRERLVRECTGIVIDGIQVVEIKWYEKGWFKVFMFVVAVFLTWLTGGASMTLYLAIQQVVIATVIAYAVAALMSNIDSPILAAIIAVVIMIYTGNLDYSSFMDMAALAVEATGTYLQKKLANDMLKLQEEAEELKREMSEAKKKLEELEDEFGINKHTAKDWILWLASLPPIEEASDWFDRVLNVDLARSDIGHLVESNIKIGL